MDADEHFLDRGVQYYVAARSAALARLVPVCGNLFHHAIEMLLKARLSQKHSLRELSRDPFRHDLRGLWAAFKAEFQEDLSEFDTTVETLNEFWELRFPDSVLEKGAAITLQWVPGAFSNKYGEEIKPPPIYSLVVPEIDRLVAVIFRICSRNPHFFTGGMNEYAREAITRDNPCADVWFAPG